MRRLGSPALAALLIGAAGCYASHRLSPPTDGEPSDDAGPEAGPEGGPSEIGDCRTDDDCERGACQRVPDLPGGYWTCVDPPDEADGPSENPDQDECERSEDCLAHGEGCRCYHRLNPYTLRGGQNVCSCQECRADNGGCGPDELCAPSGAWALDNFWDDPWGNFDQFITNSCVDTGCLVDGDCRAREGGRCVPHLVCEGWLTGKFCHYPDSDCRVDDDCHERGLGGSCEPNHETQELECSALPRGCWD